MLSRTATTADPAALIPWSSSKQGYSSLHPLGRRLLQKIAEDSSDSSWVRLSYRQLASIARGSHWAAMDAIVLLFMDGMIDGNRWKGWRPTALGWSALSGQIGGER